MPRDIRLLGNKQIVVSRPEVPGRSKAALAYKYLFLQELLVSDLLAAGSVLCTSLVALTNKQGQGKRGREEGEVYGSSPTQRSGGGSRRTQMLQLMGFLMVTTPRVRRLGRRGLAATEAVTSCGTTDLSSSMNILAWGVVDCVTGFCWQISVFVSTTKY